MKNTFCFQRSEMEGDNATNRLLSKTFVKQNISETDISEISFSFQLNSLLWWETLLKPIHCLNYLLRGHRKRKCHLPKGFLSTHSYHLPSNEDLAREPGRSLTSAAQTKRTQSFPTKTLAQHSFSEGRALLKWGQQGWRNYLIYSQSNALYSATENHIFQYSHITILGRDFEKKKLLGPIFERLSLDTSRGPHFWKARLWEPPSFPDCYCDYKQLQAIVLFNRCLKPSRTSAKAHLSWRKSTLILWITILQVSAAPTPLSPHHFLMDHPLLFPPRLFILFLFNALVLCLIHPCIKYL